MDPKKLSFSTIPFFDFFTTIQQEVRFFQDFPDRTLQRIHTLDLEAFKECEFFKTFEELNLSTFLYNPSRKVYPILVKMFFSNLDNTDGIVQSEVKMHKITLSVKEFVDIMNLPCEDTVPESEDKGYKYNYKIVACSLMKDQTPSIPNPFIYGYIYHDSRMIHYVINHILFNPI